jgi:hypothetical protein
MRRVLATLVVVGTASHGEQILQAYRRPARILRQFVTPLGEEVDDALVDALDVAFRDSDADERRGEALAHRL